MKPLTSIREELACRVFFPGLVPNPTLETHVSCRASTVTGPLHPKQKMLNLNTSVLLHPRKTGSETGARGAKRSARSFGARGLLPRRVKRGRSTLQLTAGAGRRELRSAQNRLLPARFGPGMPPAPVKVLANVNAGFFVGISYYGML